MAIDSSEQAEYAFDCEFLSNFFIAVMTCVVFTSQHLNLRVTGCMVSSVRASSVVAYERNDDLITIVVGGPTAAN